MVKNTNSKKPKLLTILGPTAVGKSDLAVHIALKENGEIISADSRQVYRQLDIGTGKITEHEMQNIPHHCLNIADPQKQFTVAEYKQRAETAIQSIYSREHLPILVGGTGFYIKAVIDDIDFPSVPPDPKLRTELEQKTTEELYKELRTKDSKRASTIQSKNKRRLIRALEIIAHNGYVPQHNADTSPYNLLQIGLYCDRDKLKERIHTRLEKRLANGMTKEAQTLHENGLSFERMINLGLEYRFLAYYLRGDLSYNEMREQIETASWKYARRQLSWFRRDARITWFDIENTNDIITYIQMFFS